LNQNPTQNMHNTHPKTDNDKGLNKKQFGDGDSDLYLV
jgi:hypothetical protein